MPTASLYDVAETVIKCRQRKITLKHFNTVHPFPLDLLLDYISAAKDKMNVLKTEETIIKDSEEKKVYAFAREYLQMASS